MEPKVTVGVTLLVVMVVAFSGVEGAGKTAVCNKYPPLVGFEMDRYLGRWWQMEKSPNWAELPGKCWSSFYYRDASNPEKVKLRMDYVTRLTNAPNTFFSNLVIESPSHDPSNFMYTAPAMPWRKKHFRVLATDYDNFAIEYMCQVNMMNNVEETVWLLTRDRRPSLEVMQQARHTLQVLGLDKVKMYEADQSCEEKPYKPNSMMDWLSPST
ncbi:apolipoprotein D [Folsomia candida]|uniref:apolipoprotein D n=1 Tax=Folsomia candida TaxID=158441 RepID=UPI000B8FA193|nr:apolipoprotein D [Folsomia candida]